MSAIRGRKKGSPLLRKTNSPIPANNGVNNGASTSRQQGSDDDDVSLAGGKGLEGHTPLLVPKKEKNYSNRPPCPIPRDPRQQTTSADVSAVIQPVTIKQEVVFHSEVEIKEEKVDEPESDSNWKEEFLRSCQDLPASSRNGTTQETNNSSQPSQTQTIEGASLLANVKIKGEPVDEPEPEEQNDDQCSVSSHSTVGLPSPKRMESFSAPASPVNTPGSPERSTQPEVLPSTSIYSAPLDLEEEYEKMEREKEKNLREKAEASSRRSYSPLPDDGSDDEHRNNSYGHPRSPPPDLENDSAIRPSESMEVDNLPQAQATPPRKKSTFTVVKNPDFFKAVAAPVQEAESSSSNNDQRNETADDQMDVDETQPTRANKIPVKVTKQNRSSMLVEDYLKAAGAPKTPSKRQAPPTPKTTKRSRSDHESLDVNVIVTPTQSNEVALMAPGPSRDPRLRNKTNSQNPPQGDAQSEPEIIEDGLTRKIKECVIRRMVKWSFKWLEQQFNNNTPPPALLQQLKKPPLSELFCTHVLSSYSTFQIYVDTFQPLILHEIWSTTFQQYKLRKPVIFDGVFATGSSGVAKKEADDIKCLRYSSLIEDKRQDEKSQLKFLQEGDLVTCSFPRPKTADLVEAFGFVMKTAITTGIRNRKIDQRLLSNSVNKDILMEATIAFRQNYTPSNPTGVFKVKKIASLYSLMALFDHQVALYKSPMCRSVLYPDVNAFKLPIGGLRYTREFMDEAQVDALLTVTQTIMMSRPEESRVALIEGPPGTGKTHVLVYMIEHFLAYKRETSRPRVFYCAPTDSAVDEMSRRLLYFREKLPESNKFRFLRLGGHSTHPNVKGYTIQGIMERRGENGFVKSEASVEVKKLENRVEELQQQKLSIIKDIDASEQALDDRMTASLKLKLADIDKDVDSTKEKIEEVIMREEEDLDEQVKAIKLDILSAADVICTTMDVAQNAELDFYLRSIRSKKDGKIDKPFLCGIIDDASMCPEPLSLMPLTLGINKLILVGDCDPIFNPLNSSIAKENGLENSLFKRFQDFVNRHSESEDRLKIKLELQYRMAFPISVWPNKFYYGNQMLSTPATLHSTPLHSYIVLDVRDSRERRDDAYLVNEPEAHLIAKLIEGFEHHTCDVTNKLIDKKIGVITFTPNQKKLIQFEIHKRCPNMLGVVEVALPQELQGREKDVILVSCIKSGTESSKGKKKKDDADADRKPTAFSFLTDYWNIALTRARETLVVCGHLRTLFEDETLKEFVLDADRRQVIRPVSSMYHSSLLYDIVEHFQEDLD